METAALPSRSPGGSRLRLAGAPMILLPMPEADDTETLLSGRAGKLLDGLLAALGLDRANVYLAPALPCHVPMPDWTQLREQGLRRAAGPSRRPGRPGTGPRVRTQRHFGR
jgi:DNA polymerase